VRPHDNFFDLGGHSLLVMKVVDRLRRSAGIELHPGELFQQTVGQIAQHHAALLGGGSGTAAAAAPQQAPDGVEAFFFAGTAGQLYGCLHGPPASPPPGAAVPALLLCAPTGHEYTRCHRALKQLATLAAAAGLSVLRFDYHGSGDADGDETAFSLSQARADIGSAVDELRRRSGAARVHLLGLRLGATLALQVACGRDDIGSAVLWEPVWDGAELLADWRAQQKAFMEALGYADAGATQEVLGSPLPAGLADEIAALGPAPQLSAAQGPERLLAIGAVPPPGWVNGRGAPPIERFDDQASPAIWRQEPLQAVVPLALLRRIVDWLGSGP
jgi:alpha/beta superfamily hydrolase